MLPSEEIKEKINLVDLIGKYVLALDKRYDLS